MKKSQSQQIFEILSDGRPHRSDEFQERMFKSTKFGLFRLGARINDLVNQGKIFLDKNGKITESGKLRGWHDSNNPALYWYWMKVDPVSIPKVATQTKMFPEKQGYFIG